VGYLLARALDTIADTAAVPAASRLEHLRALQEMIKLGRDAELLRPMQKTFSAGQKHSGEGDLLKKLDRCLAWLEAQPAADLWDLRRTLARIGYGQELDLLRFGEATARDPKPLATAAELDDYTYFVAGCVGELWTRLCERHLPAGWSALPFEEMLALGKRFGQGLQMVNILRDLPADLAAGRCYLPADLMAEHGLTVGDLLTDPEKARPLLATLRQTALAHLDAGWRYVRALKPSKLRYACSLPILIGLETLTLLARQSPLETEERVKMSRTRLRGLMASAMVGTAVSPWLTGLHDRLRRRAGAKRG
jgi:farnesyl-diphosphate farnesyltransferase